MDLKKEAENLRGMMNFQMKYRDVLPKRKREIFSDKLSHNKYLYFIQCGDAVKIGRSSDPSSRLETLATGSPGKLRLIAMIPNMGHRENELHKKFSHLHLHGEWFQYTHEINEFIREISK